jgi:Zn-dependent M16 (insulinase) family peptidase
VDWAAQVRPLLRGHLAGPESRRESVDAVAASYGQLQLSEQPTNGIAYLRLLFSLADVPRDLLVYLPLYSTVLTEMATRFRDERALAQQIDLVTGGISSDAHVWHSPELGGPTRAELSLGTHCLYTNLQAATALLSELLDPARTFSQTEQLKTLINLSLSEMQDGVTSSGHQYAMSMASAAASPKNRLSEVWGGLSQLIFLRDLSAKLQESESAFDSLLGVLRHISQLVLRQDKLRAAINAEATALEPAAKALSDVAASLTLTTPTSITAPELPARDPADALYISTPATVNFVAQAFPSVEYDSPDAAPLRLLGNVLSHGFLHKEIREKGGAYGSGLSVGDRTMSFYSYRDPNVGKSLETFALARTWVQRGKMGTSDLEEAKLLLFAGLDAPVPPSRRTMGRFSHGMSPAIRHRFRERARAAQESDLRRVAERYLSNTGRVCVLGTESQRSELTALFKNSTSVPLDSLRPLAARSD